MKPTYLNQNWEQTKPESSVPLTSILLFLSVLLLGFMWQQRGLMIEKLAKENTTKAQIIKNYEIDVCTHNIEVEKYDKQDQKIREVLTAKTEMK